MCVAMYLIIVLERTSSGSFASGFIEIYRVLKASLVDSIFNLTRKAVREVGLSILFFY